jgi:hypothetical protein
VTLSAGPISDKAEEEKFKALVQKHVNVIRTELGKMGRIIDPIQTYKKFIGSIRYEFGVRGLLVSDAEAIKMWDELYLPKFIQGK